MTQRVFPGVHFWYRDMVPLAECYVDVRGLSLVLTRVV